MARQFRPPSGRLKGPKIVSRVRRDKKQVYGSFGDWMKLRAQILKRDGNKCRRCKNGPRPGIPLNVHHIISAKMGGRSIPSNLITLCENCHSKQPHHGHMR